MAVMMLYEYNQQLDDLFMVQKHTIAVYVLYNKLLYSVLCSVIPLTAQCYNIKILLFTVVTPCEKEVHFSVHLKRVAYLCAN